MTLKRQARYYDAFALGWHRNEEYNGLPRTLTYYNGPNYVKIGFSRIFEIVNHIEWWDNATSRLNVWEPKAEDINYSNALIKKIFAGKISSSTHLSPS